MLIHECILRYDLRLLSPNLEGWAIGTDGAPVMSWA